jgi:hypothetical protein
VVGPTCQGLIPYAVFITLCFLSNKLLVVKTYGSWYTHKRRGGGGDCEYYYANGRPIQNTASRSFSARFSPASHIKVHIILSGRAKRGAGIVIPQREKERGEPMNIILFCVSGY